VSKKLKSIGVVAGLTVVSRVLGLLRDQLTGAVFGSGALSSAFAAAFRIPNLFRRLLGEGSLTAAFVPTLQGELTRQGRAAAFRLVNQVASWLFVIAGALVAVAMLACSQARLLQGYEDRWYIAADLSVLLFPYMLLICLAAVFSATLNVLQRFSEGALSPVLLNVCMIASLGGAGLHWASTPMGQMYWLCAGVLAGGVCQLALPVWALVREGWRPRPDLSLSPGVREIAVLMIPGLWGAASYQINQLVIQGLALSINDSASFLLFLSGRLMELPIGVFAIAISTVVYPSLSRHAAEGNLAAMGDDYLKGIRLILLVNIPAAAGLVLLAEPIVRVLYQHGRFTAEDSAAMIPLVLISAFGLPFFSVVSLTQRAFYALKDTGTPVRIATVCFVVNLGLAYGLRSPLGVSGLIIASTVAVILQSVALQCLLARRVPGLSLRPLARDISRIALAAGAMGVVVWGGWALLCRGQGLLGDLLALCGLIPAGVLVFGALVWRLRVGGVDEVATLALAKLGRLRGR